MNDHLSDLDLRSYSASQPVMTAHKLTVGYGAQTVLVDVEITIMPGEFWCVVGPNGAGKSTLLKAMLRLITPRAGSLTLMPELADHSRLGFVPQRLTLAETVPVTVREFVALGFTGLGLHRGERDKRLASALAQVCLSELSQRDLRYLSGGQRQRALIARALVREPLLLVVDEPTAGLDLVAQRDLMKLLTTLNHQGLTVVFVTHDLALVTGHGSHVALVAGGRVRTGLAENILTTSLLSEAFDVSMTILRTATGIHVGVGS